MARDVYCINVCSVGASTHVISNLICNIEFLTALVISVRELTECYRKSPYLISLNVFGMKIISTTLRLARML